MIREDITPAQLAHCISLASQMYLLHSQFYGADDPQPWLSLTRATKELWIDRALEVIEMVGPFRSKVVATITPDAPYGIARYDGRIA